MAGVGRGKNYTLDELKQLCYSALHVSQDPAVGNGQHAEKFWDRVAEHYNHHKPDDTEVRAKKSLEGKWADIKHDVSKFIGVYQQVEERQTSGTNNDDTLKAAKELYRENHKAFSYEAAWEILKDAPRWSVPMDDLGNKGRSKKLQSQRSAGKEKKKETISPSPEKNGADESQNEETGYDNTNNSNAQRRPIGTKRAKEELKRARVQEDVFRLTAEAQKEQAAASKDMAKANFMRARTMENTLALLSLPIDTMDPELQAFMRSWKLKEARKLKKRMQQAEIQVLPAMFPARPTLNPLPCVRAPIFPIPPATDEVEGDVTTEVDPIPKADAEGAALFSNLDAPTID